MKLDIQSIRAEFESFYSRICNLFSTSQFLIRKQKLISLCSGYVTSFHNSTNNTYRKPSKSVLTNDQKSALASLRNDPDIVITRPDKENGVCMLNRRDYVTKTLTILNDHCKFRPCLHDTSQSDLTKFQRSLYYLKSKKAIPNDVYEKIYPTATATPSLYGLPKLHKPGICLKLHLHGRLFCNAIRRFFMRENLSRKAVTHTRQDSLAAIAFGKNRCRVSNTCDLRCRLYFCATRCNNRSRP